MTFLRADRMKQRKYGSHVFVMTAVLLSGALAMATGGCGKAEEAMAQGAVVAQEYGNRENSDMGTASDNMSGNPDVSGTDAEEPPVILDILTHVQIEAGTQEITAADLFEEYDGQQVDFETELSAEELAEAAAVYEMEVRYLGQPVTVTVEVVDTTPPVIEGVEELFADAGGNVNYKKNIVLSDNANGEITLEVDRNAVDMNVPGVYAVYYIATDLSGNTATVETSITVQAVITPEEEAVNALADAVVAKQTTPEMSQYDMAYALWRWCRKNITYVTTTGDRSSVWTGAYEGLHNKKGDCYTFFATYSLLLTRCGIENLCVARVGGTSNHWWNLVHIESGWYHCDASPRREGDHYKCFMQTDAQVQAYTESYPQHPNYYTFDPELYPERATEIIFGD